MKGGDYMEEWKPIKNYEGVYEISNLGRVRSVERTIVRSDGVKTTIKSKMKALSNDKDGYVVVSLSKNGRDKKAHVHRLVAEEFVDGQFEGAEVNHIDCDRSNNKYNNLEWVTHKENVKYSIHNKNHICTKDITGVNNPNYGNHSLSVRYANDKELCIEKQSRPGAINGRSRRISVYDGNSEVEFDYIAKCAMHLISSGITSSDNVNYISTKISRAASSGKELFGMMFKFI